MSAEKGMVEKIVSLGMLEPYNSPWAAANVFVPKRDGTLRCTSDFRALNAQTICNSYPMKGSKETLDWLGSKKVFSTFDLKHGYFQVQVNEASRPLTAVRTVSGLYQYKRLPQGLKNSPAVFRRIVNPTLGSLKGQSACSFIDDGSVESETAVAHVEELRFEPSLLQAAGVKRKLSKCSFGCRSVQMLGHEVTSNGLKPSERHVAAIKALTIPHNGTELLRFMGVVNFFADFIPHLAERMQPLTDMLVGSGSNSKKRYKHAKIHLPDWDTKWGPLQKAEWRDLKDELSNPMMLACSGPTVRRRVMTDASDYGLGGVALQESKDGKWRPVSFTSRKLKGAEIRYTVTEKECLAVFHALRKWRHYLHGVPGFIVVTDHIALRWLMQLREPRRRLARLMVDVQGYDFEV